MDVPSSQDHLLPLAGGGSRTDGRGGTPIDGLLDRAKSAVRRHPRLMQLYRGLDTPLARGRFQYDRASMAGVMAANRAALKEFGPWIDDAAMEQSNLAYGLSPDWAAAMDRDIGDAVTYSDLLCYAATQSGRTAYLEIGVSVGKNFWQVLNTVRAGSVTGLDIEEINPPLRRRLEPVSVAAPGAPAPKLEQYRFAPNANDVHYGTGNVFDPALWAQLAGRKFNLVFSDAFHDPDAVMFEWERIVELDLLDRAGFTIMWDDLVSKKIRRVFNRISADAIHRYGLTPRHAGLMHVAGWVGGFEPEHPVGVISSQGFVR